MKYSTDTRTLQAGDTFIPIKGINYDGHDFIAEAQLKGAAKILDVDIAEYARKHREKFKIPIIAVTGSSGKTTVKDLIASVLSQQFKVVKTAANQNNEIGTPLSLLQIDDTTEVGVFELGMRGKGEIAYLVNIVQPTHVVITNIGITHIERLGTQDDIAGAKAEIFNGRLNQQRFAFLNQTNKYYNYLNDRATDQGFTVLPFSGNNPLDQNRDCVTRVAESFGLSAELIDRGFASFVPPQQRLEFVFLPRGITMINDCYNANPDSMRLALLVLNRQPKRRIAVLGDMFELGNFEILEHQKIAELLDSLHVEILVTVGHLAKHIQPAKLQEIYHFENNHDAVLKLTQIIRTGDSILVKGSRAMKMEEIVHAFQEHTEIKEK